MQGPAGGSPAHLQQRIPLTIQNSNEHTFTFTELERIAFSEDPDLDRVNLLIDIIRVTLTLGRIASEPMARKGRPTSTTTSNRSSTPCFLPSIDISSTQPRIRLNFSQMEPTPTHWLATLSTGRRNCTRTSIWKPRRSIGWQL